MARDSRKYPFCELSHQRERLELRDGVRNLGAFFTSPVHTGVEPPMPPPGSRPPDSPLGVFSGTAGPRSQKPGAQATAFLSGGAFLHSTRVRKCRG
jgi:hypothetical protein